MNKHTPAVADPTPQKNDGQPVYELENLMQELQEQGYVLPIEEIVYYYSFLEPENNEPDTWNPNTDSEIPFLKIKYFDNFNYVYSFILYYQYKLGKTVDELFGVIDEYVNSFELDDVFTSKWKNKILDNITEVKEYFYNKVKELKNSESIIQDFQDSFKKDLLPVESFG